MKQMIDQAIKNNNSFKLGVCYVSLSEINEHQIMNIKRNLTFREVDFHSGETIETVSYYEQQNYLIIPRYYEEVYGALPSVNFVFDNRIIGEFITIDCNSAPRNEAQVEMVTKFMQLPNTGVIKAPPGFGKSYIGVRLTTMIKRKVLILIDNVKLGKQWIGDFQKFTGISDDEVSIIEGTDKFTAKRLNKPVVVTTIQTLSSMCKNDLLPTNPKVVEMMNANFGFIIIDEIHKSFGSPEFSKAAVMFSANKILGLSATPRKTSTAATDVLLSYFNNTILSPKYEKLSKLYCQIFHFNSGFERKTINWMSWGGRFDLNKYQKKLVESTPYLTMIKNIALLLKDKKKIIFIAHTVNILQSLIDYLVKEDVFNREELGLAIAGCSEDELKHMFVFSTYKMLTAGLSINHMDTIIYLTPPGASTTGIEQSSGRVDRDHNDALTKKLVIDLVDEGIPQLASRIVARKKEYQRLNIIIEHEFKYNSELERFSKFITGDEFSEKYVEPKFKNNTDHLFNN